MTPRLIDSETLREALEARAGRREEDARLGVVASVCVIIYAAGVVALFVLKFGGGLSW
jgi:hypothetical protein